MKKLNQESLQKILTKLGRCKRFPGYSIAFYICEDTECIEEIISDYFHETPYEVTREGKSFTYTFSNGSYVICVSTDNIIPNKTTHIAYVDVSVKPELISESIKPHICEYVDASEMIIANPKPIYISETEN
jgi:hypothetical protein